MYGIQAKYQTSFTGTHDPIQWIEFTNTSKL